MGAFAPPQGYFSGGAIGSPITFPNGTAGAPSITFTSETTLGMFRSASGVMGLGSTFSRVALGDATASFPAIGRSLTFATIGLGDGTAGGGLGFGSTGVAGWTAGVPSSTIDTGISRDSAAVIDLGNGAFADSSATARARAYRALNAGSTLNIAGIDGNSGATAGVLLATTAKVIFSSTTDAYGTADGFISRRGAVGTIGLSDSATATAFHVYNTTDVDTGAPTNYERVSLDWTTNAGSASLIVQKGGTGAAKTIFLGTAGNSAIQFVTNNTSVIQLQGSGALVWNTDNTLDIGASGANRPRNLFLGGYAQHGWFIQTKTASTYTVTTADVGTHFNNSGAAGQVAFTLPASAAGLTYSFYVATAQNLRISGNGSDTIRQAASVSTATTGHIDNATIGGYITLVCHAAGQWVAMATPEGTWTVT